MSERKRKRVTDEFGVIEDGMSLQTIRDLCDSAINSTEWINCRLEVKWPDCKYAVDRYVIEGERWETDKELTKRLKEEERTRLVKTKKKADKEAYERQQYEHLKKKFESK